MYHYINKHILVRNKLFILRKFVDCFHLFKAQKLNYMVNGPSYLQTHYKYKTITYLIIIQSNLKQIITFELKD